MNEPVSILDRLQPTAQDDSAEIDVYSEGEDYRAFGFSRKPIASDPMIDFIDRHGVHEALSYSHLYRIRFDPSEGMTLEFTDHIVTLRGHHLQKGHQRLTMHRVVFIAEADHATAALVTADEPVITSLALELKRNQ
ncbi:MAG: hypothetical protein AAGG48_18130 [Planctomycetota bacterium]